jgi:hypothetical protein
LQHDLCDKEVAAAHWSARCRQSIRRAFEPVEKTAVGSGFGLLSHLYHALRY